MVKSRLKELKDNHEFRKSEGWEKTTLSEDVDWLIEQAERVERYEKAIQTFEQEYAHEYYWQFQNATGKSQWQKGGLVGFEHVKRIFDKHFF